MQCRTTASVVGSRSTKLEPTTTSRTLLDLLQMSAPLARPDEQVANDERYCNDYSGFSSPSNAPKAIVSPFTALMRRPTTPNKHCIANVPKVSCQNEILEKRPLKTYSPLRLSLYLRKECADESATQSRASQQPHKQDER